MTGKEWLAVYEQSGEMPPAEVLARQLAALDAKIEALECRGAELTAALSGLICTGAMGDTEHRCPWASCRVARRALTPTESEAK